ncbi:olfactory receptor 6F1-like [Alligator mississippiensis]|uniref:olfactory receptor 6F1-like n=1 Tax=Alligator mississippiensis TaxID=8496 RepID=UPI00287803AE|nr:olfactory receptor 6F1-like [Alligator mississippiensis]
MGNHSSVQEFILLGFPGTWYFHFSLSVVFSLMYGLTVIGNVSIIALVWTTGRLHTPMYYFLCNLSFLEIWYTTACVTKAVGVLLGNSQTISFTVCILQLFLIFSLGSTECFLLAVMAYDRYLAICHLLHYSSLMSNTFCIQLAFAAWLSAFLGISVLEFSEILLSLKSQGLFNKKANIKQPPSCNCLELRFINKVDCVAGVIMGNHSSVQEFILLGFPGTWYFRFSLSVVFSVMYALTVIGNVSIIALVWTTARLHTPMYYFLCNLSFLEIWYTTTCVPKAMGVLLGNSQTISFTVCILQLFLIFSLGSTECFLLAVMAYDRYLAICHPLRYSSLMSNTFCTQLAFAAWLSGFLGISLMVFLISRLSFCGPNIINHFFCDMDSLIALSCTDTSLVELAEFFVSIIVVVASCAVTLISYIYIISTILKIRSTQGRQKAFSTCSAHLTVVTIWFGSTIFLYVKPSAPNSLDMNKLINSFNTIITPLLNPFIYTLRNKEVKRALSKMWILWLG